VALWRFLGVASLMEIKIAALRRCYCMVPLIVAD
jgi:hypothetical protein